MYCRATSISSIPKLSSSSFPDTSGLIRNPGHNPLPNPSFSISPLTYEDALWQRLNANESEQTGSVADDQVYGEGWSGLHPDTSKADGSECLCTLEHSPIRFGTSNHYYIMLEESVYF